MTDRLHPYVVHFAAALLVASVVLFLVGSAYRSRPWSGALLDTARWNLWIGAAFALLAIATGFLDYIASHCDRETISATILHRRSGAVTWWSALIAGIAAYRTRHRPPGALLLAWLLLVGAAAVTATALGTGLTYDRGLGVGNSAADGAPACFEMERGAPSA